MQSINAGFASLKTLIPHHDGEKLSKVILSSVIMTCVNVNVFLVSVNVEIDTCILLFCTIF